MVRRNDLGVQKTGMVGFPDNRFFLTRDPMTIAQILSLTQDRLLSGEEARLIERLSAPDQADHGCAIFINRKYAVEDAGDTNAGLILIKEEFVDAFKNKNKAAVMVCENPRLSFSILARALHASRSETDPPEIGISKTAKIAEGCAISRSASIGDGAEIAANCVIGPYAVIGQGVVLGQGCSVSPHATLTHAIVGEECCIRGGAVVGEAGFGFVPTPAGLKHVPQLGRVLLGREVDIGANTTVDRGALGDTQIGDYSKIDNLVQIAHNVTIGSNCAIAAQTGISGSTDIGDNVMIGGQAGVADHVTIGSDAVIKARAAILVNVPANEHYGGYSAKPARDWMREIIAVHRLARIKRPDRAGKKK